MTLSPQGVLVLLLWPLLLANVLMWGWYAHAPLMSIAWALALVASPKLLPQ